LTSPFLYLHQLGHVKKNNCEKENKME